MLRLYIGNKNYSSWSMRPWVLMRQAGIGFEEVMVRFGSFAPDSAFKRTLDGVTPAGKVPALLDDGFAVWDSLAIAEYLAERFPDKALWPAGLQARARARSVCAEMHAGFAALRTHCPMNIEASLPAVGARVLAEQPAVRADLDRLAQMWTGLLAQHPHPDGLLFGAFTVADAYFAPVCMRLRTYALPVPPEVAAYVQRVCDLPGVRAWMADALAEQDFVPGQEPYRTSR